MTYNKSSETDEGWHLTYGSREKGKKTYDVLHMTRDVWHLKHRKWREIDYKRTKLLILLDISKLYVSLLKPYHQRQPSVVHVRNKSQRAIFDSYQPSVAVNIGSPPRLRYACQILALWRYGNNKWIFPLTAGSTFNYQLFFSNKCKVTDDVSTRNEFVIFLHA